VRDPDSGVYAAVLLLVCTIGLMLLVVDMLFP